VDKDVDDLWTMTAPSFVWYNFVRIHQTLRCSPAMEAGIESHLWSIEEIAELVG
jgi:hypothetical protein